MRPLSAHDKHVPHATLRGVTRVYSGATPVHALGPLDLDLAHGEFFSVVGPSGCGKSTLLDVLAGLNPPTVGSVSFEGKPVVGEVPDGIGVVFQEDSSFPWLTVRDNVAFGLRHAGVEFSDHHGQHVRIGSWPFQNALPAWAVARRIAFSALTMLGSRS